MGYVCDRFTFLLDFYHALGCYFIIGGSDKWMKAGTPPGKYNVYKSDMEVYAIVTFTDLGNSPVLLR
jgi:hypothetical protein